MDQKFWNRFAFIYDRFMKKDQKAYEEMYILIRKCIQDKNVLELATGTGLIAKHVADVTKQMEAADYAESMIKQAKKGTYSSKLRFSVEDACHLSYASDSFDVVLISNALHIMPEPQRALQETRRVLKPEGILIAPTFIHGSMSPVKKFFGWLMGLAGFHAKHKWTAEEYVDFLHANGWKIKKKRVLAATFPLMYVEAMISSQRIK